jgi:hypothetical protein
LSFAAENSPSGWACGETHAKFAAFFEWNTFELKDSSELTQDYRVERIGKVAVMTGRFPIFLA